MVGAPDPIMFEDPNVGRWVDPLASWEVMDDNESETTTQKDKPFIFSSNDTTIESIKTDVNESTSKFFTVTNNLTIQQTTSTPKSVLPTLPQNNGSTKTLTTIVSEYTKDGESEKSQITTETTVVSDFMGSGASENTSPAV